MSFLVQTWHVRERERSKNKSNIFGLSRRKDGVDISRDGKDCQQSRSEREVLTLSFRRVVLDACGGGK